MNQNSRRRDEPEVLSQRAHRLLIGTLGLVLPILVYFVAGLRPTKGLASWKLLGSVSEYYYTGAVSVFVGVIFALSLFLLTYRGYKGVIADRVVGSLGGVAALVVVLCPTGPPSGTEAPSWWRDWSAIVHYAGAIALFCSFIAFSVWLFRRSNVPREQQPTEKRRRDDVCLACGLVMIAALSCCALIGVRHLETSIFWPESVAIEAFAISWLVKGEVHRPIVRAARRLLDSRPPA